MDMAMSMSGQATAVMPPPGESGPLSIADMIAAINAVATLTEAWTADTGVTKNVGGDPAVATDRVYQVAGQVGSTGWIEGAASKGPILTASAFGTHKGFTFTKANTEYMLTTAAMSALFSAGAASIICVAKLVDDGVANAILDRGAAIFGSNGGSSHAPGLVHHDEGSTAKVVGWGVLADVGAANAAVKTTNAYDTAMMLGAGGEYGSTNENDVVVDGTYTTSGGASTGNMDTADTMRVGRLYTYGSSVIGCAFTFASRLTEANYASIRAILVQAGYLAS